jgi:hypothetical protein
MPNNIENFNRALDQHIKDINLLPPLSFNFSPEVDSPIPPPNFSPLPGYTPNDDEVLQIEVEEPKSEKKPKKEKKKKKYILRGKYNLRNKH